MLKIVLKIAYFELLAPKFSRLRRARKARYARRRQLDYPYQNTEPRRLHEEPVPTHWLRHCGERMRGVRARGPGTPRIRLREDAGGTGGGGGDA